MHALYVDESGTPEDEPGVDHFVLAGLAIPLASWRTHDAQLGALLLARRLSGVELHVAWMARRYPEQERIRDFDKLDEAQRRAAVTVERGKDLAKASLKGEAAVRGLKKNYEKTKAYIHLSHAERLDALRAVADALGSWNDARLFADAQKKSVIKPKHRAQAREFALEQVTTRFSTYLRRFAPGSLGIVIHDQHQAESTKLTLIFRRWHKEGTAYFRIPNIAETPLFVDSALTAMVQLADLVAYATRRFFDKGETDLFDRIYGRFDRSAENQLVGLRHYTATSPCGCRVCRDHGR
jgi:hypothetical protein